MKSQNPCAEIAMPSRGDMLLRMSKQLNSAALSPYQTQRGFQLSSSLSDALRLHFLGGMTPVIFKVDGIWHSLSTSQRNALLHGSGFQRGSSILSLNIFDPVALSPSNLVVRMSGAMIDGAAPSNFPNTSTVVKLKDMATCPAYTQGGVCGTCRNCWDPNVKNIAYPKH